MLTNEQHALVIDLINLTEDRTRLQAMQTICPSWCIIGDNINLYLEDSDSEAKALWRELNE